MSLVAAIVVTRLLVVPAMTYPLIYFAYKTFFPADKLLAAILFLESTPPPAFQIITMVQMQFPEGEGVVARGFMWQYAMGTFTMLVWMTISLLIL